MLFRSILGAVIVLVPWLDRGPSSLYYTEPATASPLRLALGLATITLFLALSLAGFGAELGLSVPVLWVITVAAPLGAAWVAHAFTRRRAEGALAGSPQ